MGCSIIICIRLIISPEKIIFGFRHHLPICGTPEIKFFFALFGGYAFAARPICMGHNYTLYFY